MDNLGIQTSFYKAVCDGHLDRVRYLIYLGADINPPSRTSANPLIVSIMEGHVDIARTLIDSGATINCSKKGDWSPAHWAALMGRDEILELLIKNKADLNCRGPLGNTPLELAQFLSWL